MERKATLEEARKILGDNILGVDSLSPFFEKMGLNPAAIGRVTTPEITYTSEQLKFHANRSILVLGVSEVASVPFTIRAMRNALGLDPEVAEPCFYNQDWYLHESFIDTTLEHRWYLVQKDVLANSRAVDPRELLSSGISFPPAVLCAYAFFAYYFRFGIPLWKHDFLWCSDTDHNGDRIYVGKYHDVDGINKSGFSIHRHLSLRDCYSAIPFEE